jgi:hypothetical protein
MSVILNCNAWAQDVFGACKLGDHRLTKRLQTVGTQLSEAIGTSLASSCQGSDAALEGAYRMIRNEKVKASNIAEGGFQSTVKNCAGKNVLLAIEDTTSMAFKHQVKDELGDLGGPEHSNYKGFIIHSSLMVDGETENTIGLIDQKIWCRNPEDRGKKDDNKERDYKKRESYKWENSSNNISNRMGELMSRVISVCDRESDIYEYLRYKLENNQRFIVRAAHNRRLEKQSGLLFDQIKDAPLLGEYKIDIAQKGGRAARTAIIELRTKQITLLPRNNSINKNLVPLTVNVVFASEKNSVFEESLQWVLLTGEDITSFTNARCVTRFYELRWRIEDFHKAWKTGAGAERQRMQERTNLEKMVVILGFLAVRLLQLKEGFAKERMLDSRESKVPCTTVLSQDEFTVLWLSVEKKKSLPKQAPGLGWAHRAIAKLGGWNDTKRTGKASWATIWKGWFKLSERIEGYTLFKDCMSSNGKVS